MTFEESFQLENIAKPTENCSGTNPDLNVKWVQHKNNKGVSMSENNLERVSKKKSVQTHIEQSQTAVLIHYFSSKYADQKP